MVDTINKPFQLREFYVDSLCRMYSRSSRSVTALDNTQGAAGQQDGFVNGHTNTYSSSRCQPEVVNSTDLILIQVVDGLCQSSDVRLRSK